MNSLIVKFLADKGYSIPDTNMYETIEGWKEWYKNKVDFHTYKDNFGTTRQMYSLGMAKRLSEDWASIIFTEKDEITNDVERNNNFIQEFIKKTKLRNNIYKAVEKASWSGTCAGVLRLKNIVLKGDKLQPSDKTEFELLILSADHIIPLRIEHGKIVDVAFTSEIVKDKKKLIYIELHQLTDNGYKITNSFIDVETGKEVEYEDTLKEYYTLTDTPLFAILEPPIVNEIDNNLGLGLSIYGNSIDQLKAVDVIYHNFVMDFVLGGKKVLYNKKLVKYKTVTVKKPDGTTVNEEVPIYPDDITKQQFQTIGDEVENVGENSLIHEINPTLRVDENKDGLQFALDILSFNANLGTKYYEFSDGNVVTATQYVGDRQDLMKNAKKYRNNLDEFIEDIIKAGLTLGRLVLKENVTEECNVEVVNRDGILVSDEELREQYINEIAQGLRSKIGYLMKFYGMTEKQAIEELKLIEKEDNLKEDEEI